MGAVSEVDETIGERGRRPSFVEGGGVDTWTVPGFYLMSNMN